MTGHYAHRVPSEGPMVTGHICDRWIVSVMETKRTMEIIVIGGSYAGLSAALRAKRRVGSSGTVRVVTDNPMLFEKIRLHELAARPRPVDFDVSDLLSGTGVELEIGRVSTIDLTHKRVVTERRSLSFDRLVLAVGSGTDRSLPGARDFAHAYDDPEGAAKMRKSLIDLSRSGGGKVLIVGGGLTAIEASTEISEAFPRLDVELLAASPLGDGLPFSGRSYLARRLADMKVMVHDRGRAIEIERHRVRTERRFIDFDLCVMAAGFVASPLAERSGLIVNDRRQMTTDATLRSLSHSFVYGAGDAAIPAVDVGGPIVMACRTAEPMGAYVGDALGREARGEASTPFRFADSGRCISLGRHDALVTVHRANGQPTDHILTGRLGAFVKESICRYTVARLRAEALRARLVKNDGSRKALERPRDTVHSLQ